MPGIRTSAITYRRGISNSTPNFFLVAQSNYVIPQPTSRFRQNNVMSFALPPPLGEVIEPPPPPEVIPIPPLIPPPPPVVRGYVFNP
jgi:hypothetical protein